MKKKYVFLAILVLSFSFYSEVFAKDKTEIVGTVIAEQVLYGHIYNSEEIIPTLLIVRVDKVINGELASKYILLNYYWRLKDKQTPIYNEFATQWKFLLTKEKSCRSRIKDIQFVIFGQKETGIMPRFSRNQGIDFEPLPFDEVLPCYKLKRNNFSKIDSFEVDKKKVSFKDTERYVLEKERWINAVNTPFFINLTPHGDFAFENVSQKNITEYQFGCVSKNTEGKFEVLENFPPEKTDLQPEKTFWSTNSIGTNKYMEQLKICHDKNGTFSTIKVKFEDSAIWEIN